MATKMYVQQADPMLAPITLEVLKRLLVYTRHLVERNSIPAV